MRTLETLFLLAMVTILTLGTERSAFGATPALPADCATLVADWEPFYRSLASENRPGVQIFEQMLAGRLVSNCGKRAVDTRAFERCAEQLRPYLRPKTKSEDLARTVQYYANVKSVCGTVGPLCAKQLRRETRDYSVKSMVDIIDECAAQKGELFDVSQAESKRDSLFVISVDESRACRIACQSRR